MRHKYCLLATIFVLLFCPAQAAAEFALEDIETTRGNRYFDIYDYSLPSLISVILLGPKDPGVRKLHRVVSYVNYHSTPARYTRYMGLGSGGFWDQNASIMLCSGNLFCSEQSSLASMILEPYFPQKAVHDIANHTFHDILMKGRWVILDPMFDMRILNGLGRPATFTDVEIYHAGDDGALRLPEDPLPRTLDYLSAYKKNNYKKIRHPYGERLVYPPAPFDLFLNKDLTEFKDFLSERGEPLNEKFNPNYLLYLRNQIRKLAATAADPRAETWKIQDFFLERIRGEAQKGEAPEITGSRLYEARNKQLLGRFREALAIYEELEQTEPIRLFQAQIHCLNGNEKAFDSLSEWLADNPYYRHMHYLVHGRYLRHDDAEFFRNFRYRWITEPPVFDQPPFDLPDK